MFSDSKASPAMNRQNGQSHLASAQILPQNPYNQYFSKRKEKQSVSKSSNDKFKNAQSNYNKGNQIPQHESIQSIISQSVSNNQKRAQNINFINANPNNAIKKISFPKNDPQDIKINPKRIFLKNTSLTVDHQQQSEQLRENQNYKFPNRNANQTNLELTRISLKRASQSVSKNQVNSRNIAQTSQYTNQFSKKRDSSVKDFLSQQNLLNKMGVIGVSQHSTQNIIPAQSVINLKQIGANKVFSNNVNISSISTNPSTAQNQVRNQKTVLENHNKQQQLMTMNQRTHDNNTTIGILASRPSQTQTNKIESIKNIYQQIQTEKNDGGQYHNSYNNNFGKVKKSRNFGVSKTSGVSSYSQQSKDGGVSRTHGLVGTPSNNYFNGTSKKSKESTGFVTKNSFGQRTSNGNKQQSIPRELEVRGQGNLLPTTQMQGILSSHSTDQIIQGNQNHIDLHKYFGQMNQRQKEKQDEIKNNKESRSRDKGAVQNEGLDGINEDSVLKESPIPAQIVQQIESDVKSQGSKYSGDITSAGINYFQNQGKIMKTQMRSQQKNRTGSQNSRGPKRLDPVEFRQKGLPELPTTYTKSEGQKVVLQSKTALAQICNSASKNGSLNEKLLQPTDSQKIKMSQHTTNQKIQRKNFARNLQNLGKINKPTDSSNAMSLKDKLYEDEDEDDECLTPYDQLSGRKVLIQDCSIEKVHPLTGKSYGKILTEQIQSIDQWPLNQAKDSNSPLFTQGEVTYNSIESKPREAQSMVNHTSQERENKDQFRINQRAQQRVHLAPLKGHVGASPSTANTHQGQQRQNYKLDAQSHNSGNKMQYRLPSQQCQSEMYPLSRQNQYRSKDQDNDLNFSGYEGQQHAFNLNSNFEESFDALNDQNQGNLLEINNGLDPNDPQGMSHIPSVQKITAIRNQKSQGTYRHNHKKISDVCSQYRNIPTQQEIYRRKTECKMSENGNNLGGYEIMAGMSSDNQDHAPSQGNLAELIMNDNKRNFCSQSEAHDQQSLQNINDINSQINDNATVIQKNGPIKYSQVSHLSQNSEQRMLSKNKSNLSKRDTISLDEQPHPFNGPKLHLFRKGQSKSSQSKLRKIKTSEQNQRLIELNSQANYSQHHNSNNITPNYGLHLSEGGPVNKMNVLPKLNHNKDGLVNIQDILNANQHSQMQGVTSQLNAVKIYNDINSQCNISQNSNDILRVQTLQTPGQHHNTDLHSFNDQDYSVLTSNDINGYEPGLVQFPSQSATIQHNTIYSRGNMESRERTAKFNLPNLTSSNSSQNVLYQNRLPVQQLNGSYQVNNVELQNMTDNMRLDNSKSEKYLQRLDQRQNSQSMRPNTTNPVFPGGNQNKQQSSMTLLKPLKVNGNSSSGGGSFQHPKVGKNSKHPDVFKNSQESSAKNLSRQIVSSKLLNESQNLQQYYENGADIDDAGSLPSHDLQTDAQKDYEYDSSKGSSPLQDKQSPTEQQFAEERLSSSRKTGQFESLQQETNKQQLQITANGPDEQIQDNKQINTSPKVYQKVEQVTLNDFKIGTQKNEVRKELPPEDNRYSKRIKSNLQNQEKKPSVRHEKSKDQNQSFSESVQKQNSIKSKKSRKYVSKTQSNAMNQDTLGNTFTEQPKLTNQNEMPTQSSHESNLNHSYDLKNFTNDSYNNLRQPKNQNNNFALTQQKLTSGKNDALNSDSVTSHENTVPITQVQQAPTNSSVAQTPCFAETPNTTDQFKGYKIEITDGSKIVVMASQSGSGFGVKLNMGEIEETKQDQQQSP